MNEREELFATIDEYQARLEVLPSERKFDRDQFRLSEQNRFYHLSDAEFAALFDEAMLADEAEQRRLITLDLLKSQMADRRSIASGAKATAQRQLESTIPLALAEAIVQTQGRVDADQNFSLPAGFKSDVPGSSAMFPGKLRRPQDDARLARAQHALQKLESLRTQRGDLLPLIRAIRDELHAADMAADVTTESAKPPKRPQQTPDHDPNMAVIEATSGAITRERLYQAG